MKYQMTEQKRAAFLEFAAGFHEDVYKSLIVFCDYVVDKSVIPYKIKNREFVVNVAQTTAFSITLTFKNVLIEDGRHPREILMTDVRGEKTKGGYRIYFKNGLNADAEGTLKESSFFFEDVQARIVLWNYNLCTFPLTKDTDKVPWRLVCEPIDAFMDKWLVLGKQWMNTYEIEYALFFKFLHLYLGWYLHPETEIGYGRTSIKYDRSLEEICHLTKPVLRAAKRVFLLCQWEELAHLADHYEEDPYAFFEAWVYKITHKEGRFLFDLLRDILEKCCRNYPRIGSVLSIYAGNHSQMKGMLDTLFKNRGWFGHYPVYSYKIKPKFIETNTVYERKYTYINEKKKTLLMRFVESVHDGGIQLVAVEGSILSRDRNEKTLINDALYGYFSDGGRREAHLIEETFITNTMTREELGQNITLFFKNCMTDIGFKSSGL